MPYDTLSGRPRGLDDLGWFVGWRTWAWTPAVQQALGDLNRFRGKRVLELGYRTGKMSCYFGLLGAIVHGLDMPQCLPDSAASLASELGLSGRVTFASYDGDLGKLEEGQWDFVFTKSVLVLLPIQQAAPAIRRLLAPGGQYLACENRLLPMGLNRLRRHRIGVGRGTISVLRQHFSDVKVKCHWWLVTSIVASR